MKNILDYLKQPFPYPNNRWMIILLPTVWVFVLLNITRPLGLSIINVPFRVVVIFAIITAIISTIVCYIFPLVFKSYFNPDNWTRGKYFSLALSIMGLLAPVLMVLWYQFWSKDMPIPFFNGPFERIIGWYVVVLAVGIFPTLIIYFRIEKAWLKDELQKSYEINTKTAIEPSEYDEDIVSLAVNGKDMFEIPIKDFLYAEVLGNYVTVSFYKNGVVQQASLRTTLSKILEKLSGYSYIIRCHRAFVVNTHYVTTMKGNARTCFLVLNHVLEEIPVSRPYVKFVKDVLKG